MEEKTEKLDAVLKFDLLKTTFQLDLIKNTVARDAFIKNCDEKYNQELTILINCMEALQRNLDGNGLSKGDTSDLASYRSCVGQWIKSDLLNLDGENKKRLLEKLTQINSLINARNIINSNIKSLRENLIQILNQLFSITVKQTIVQDPKRLNQIISDYYQRLLKPNKNLKDEGTGTNDDIFLRFYCLQRIADNLKNAYQNYIESGTINISDPRFLEEIDCNLPYTQEDIEKFADVIKDTETQNYLLFLCLALIKREQAGSHRKADKKNRVSILLPKFKNSFFQKLNTGEGTNTTRLIKELNDAGVPTSKYKLFAQIETYLKNRAEETALPVFQ